MIKFERDKGIFFGFTKSRDCVELVGKTTYSFRDIAYLNLKTRDSLGCDNPITHPLLNTID